MKVSKFRAIFQEEVRCDGSNVCCSPQCVSRPWSLTLSCLLFSIVLLIAFSLLAYSLTLKESCLSFHLGVPQIGLLQEGIFSHIFWLSYLKQTVLIKVCHLLMYCACMHTLGVTLLGLGVSLSILKNHLNGKSFYLRIILQDHFV